MSYFGAHRVALAALETAGGVAAIPNPEGVPLIITRVVVHLTTVSAGAGTVDAGVAANATTLSDNLIDGLNVQAATGVFDNVEDKGTNGKARQLWPTTGFLTISKASGAAAGLAGYVYIDYTRTA